MVRRLSNRGFSLMELMVVVVMLAVGLAIALPSFMELGRRNTVKAEARQLKNLLEQVRMDAVRNRQGLTATIDDVNNRFIVSETNGGAVVSTIDFDGVQFNINRDPPDIVWDARGMTTSNCTIDLAGEEATYSVVISMAGNIRIVKK